MSAQQDLYLIADELRATASQGLRFAENEYDKGRYEQVLRACARIIAAVNGDSGSSVEDMATRFHDNLYHISPVLCVESVVFRDGKLLLIQRSDDQLWAIPGGLSEVGETVAEAAIRELWEEAGVRGRNPRLLGLFDSRPWQSRSRMHLVSAMFQLETDDLPGLHSMDETAHPAFHESLAVDFFDEAHLPPLSQGHHLRVPFVFKMLRGEVPIPFFDR